ncbi:MAG: tRNA (adenine-N1)-methyltransferase [Chloroflexi bacterium]|nr:tRNA (adenine-N1)-methyltransferase [Chloroflexota bacterium]
MTPPAQAAGSGVPLADGDVALLVDAQGRNYLVKLGEHRAFHSHIGFLRHEDIIGKPEGTRLVTSQGKELLLLRPRLVDFVLMMQRRTQIVYPKDTGAILMAADIFPGAVVVEAGTGSGALTLALLRSVGPQGRVISYEVRSDMAELALSNIRQFLGQVPHNLELRVQDVCQGLAEVEIDRIILDLPQPWLALPAVVAALRPGGVLLAYLPTILQVHRLVETLRQDQAFDLVETMEVLLRTWHVGGVSVRPDHRMVAHTAFIVTARRLAHRPPGEQAG